MSLPHPLAIDLELKAQKSGLSTSEYIRILIFNDTKDIRENIPQLSKEAEMSVTESMQAYEKGEYITLDSKEKMDKFLKGDLNE